MIRIVIADDHILFRQGLRALLGREEDIEIAGEAGDGSDTLNLIMEERPDIALVDVSMPGCGGIEIAGEMQRRGIDTRIIILTMHTDLSIANSALAAGARGYILKEDTFSDVVYAVRSVAAGGVYISPAIAGGLADARNVAGDVLTKREKEILRLIASGMKNQEIADHLFISVKTVETHRARIMKKTNLHNTADLVKYAIRTGIAPDR